MTDSAFATALDLIVGLDPDLLAIVSLSLRISLTAVAIAAALALPLGAALALYRFPGRAPLIIALNALMGLPPVVAGLSVYLLLSRAGPLGSLGLLFTPTAMVVAQVILVLPILASLTRQKVEELHGEYAEQLASMGISRVRRIPTLLWDARLALITVMLAGFGRASAEVGAVMIVGGNIDGVTRVMTTAIVLETSKGNLPLALGLGIVLLALVGLINALAHLIGESTRRQLG
ncbi:MULTISPECIES: ABC transporter permease [Halomonas]|uniref:ABC transporter permease n=1 Tax=Halomonas TaxID=2745 RepID=UPI001A8E46C0|nr:MULTISPECIES: ABC transporter permease [Halomonas]MBN8410955.1 ABC transporter permease [Halomonas litopenaei]MBY5930425.1 ABC transporter permease [Halomonas sp. DP8Y7-3]MBY5969502.1 ABC transporter permease [Halomonas denitrificans]MED5295760.1 ABC transporter permease [Pseudomonadota bacterium]